MESTHCPCLSQGLKNLGRTIPWMLLLPSQPMRVIFGPLHYTRDIQALESVQKFVLRVIIKHWAHSYEELLSLSTLPTLEKRRLYLRLQFLYKIVKDLFFLMVLLLSEARRATIFVPFILFLFNNPLPEPTDCYFLLFLTLFLFGILYP